MAVLFTEAIIFSWWAKKKKNAAINKLLISSNISLLSMFSVYMVFSSSLINTYGRKNGIKGKKCQRPQLSFFVKKTREVFSQRNWGRAAIESLLDLPLPA
eukprot:GEMP01113827.1.p1 GENE.GEMP01113827.1~~GEMP01113827.1.p1  ORF type:complete len:100 (+),score=0.06 GEMP01113827.1:92-391(+)